MWLTRAPLVTAASTGPDSPSIRDRGLYPERNGRLGLDRAAAGHSPFGRKRLFRDGQADPLPLGRKTRLVGRGPDIAVRKDDPAAATLGKRIQQTLQRHLSPVLDLPCNDAADWHECDQRCVRWHAFDAEPLECGVVRPVVTDLVEHDTPQKLSDVRVRLAGDRAVTGQPFLDVVPREPVPNLSVA